MHAIPGSAYTALSRVKALSQLRIEGQLTTNDVQPQKAALEFDVTAARDHRQLINLKHCIEARQRPKVGALLLAKQLR